MHGQESNRSGDGKEGAFVDLGGQVVHGIGKVGYDATAEKTH